MKLTQSTFRTYTSILLLLIFATKVVVLNTLLISSPGKCINVAATADDKKGADSSETENEKVDYPRFLCFKFEILNQKGLLVVAQDYKLSSQHVNIVIQPPILAWRNTITNIHF